MQYKVFIIFLFTLIVCTQAKTKMHSSTGSKLGEACEYDDDCDVTYSFCRAQQTCECKRGFEPGPTKDRCMATVGAICTSSYDCTGLPNSECYQEVCSCRSGYVPHPSMKECLQVASIYEATCTEHVQCTNGLEGRIECNNGKCKCMQKHHYVNGMCISSKGLDEMCTDSDECHVSDEDPSKNDQVECTAGRCQCIMGYHVATDHLTCTNGAQSTHIMQMSALLVTGLICLISRFIH